MIEKKFKFFLLPIKIINLILRYKKSKRFIKNLLKQKNNIFIELGAGDKKGLNGWLTIDVTKNCDIFWDLKKGLPFPNESVSKIYSSHFFEHFSFKEIQFLLDECKRVLAPEGIFSICVPDAKIYIEAYMKTEFLNKENLFLYKPAYNNTNKIDYLNYIAYMDGEHKYMFDQDNLIYLLKAKGFKNVELRKFDSELDLKDRDFGSIYAQAKK